VRRLNEHMHMHMHMHTHTHMHMHMLVKRGGGSVTWCFVLTYLLTTRYAAFDAIAAAHVHHLEGGRGVQAAEARRDAAKRTRRRKNKKSS
jgi:hypothetical protein